MNLRWCAYATFVATEVLLYVSYRHHDANFHWFLHFFVGASTALLLMTLWAWRTRRSALFPLTWILLGHAFAMIPDFLFLCCSIIHQSWMDIFLWHLGAHFIPGRNWTWYTIFMACLAIHLTQRAYLARQR